MTAVLSPTDPLKHGRTMSSHDDNQINYSSGAPTDWKEKYYEAADMLQETRAELDDFQRSSKDLEEELERELERTEKGMQDLRVKAARAETERDEWKAKFVSLQTTHNTTTTSLQREVDQLRQSHQQLKIQLRELEMGNDDLERNERAVSSSLADVESKYAKALEEKILLEHELLDKANVEEECQRMKDETRDANLEISLLREQLSQARAYAKGQTRTATMDSSSTSGVSYNQQMSSQDNILAESPPKELQLSDLEIKTPAPVPDLSRSSSEFSTNYATTRNYSSSSMDSSDKDNHSTLLKRVGLPPGWAGTPPNSGKTSAVGMIRSQTLNTYSPSRLPSSNSTPRATLPRNQTEATAPSLGAPSKSRGVQMVSEMRARVRNLEQRLHSRVPRLRVGSTAGRKASGSAPVSAIPSALPMRTSTSSHEFSTPETRRVSVKRSMESDPGGKSSTSDTTKSAADTSGWVLIMEEQMTPSPSKDKEKNRRRLSSPTSSPFRLDSIDLGDRNRSSLDRSTSMRATSNSFSISDSNFGKSTVRRPQSRLSTDGRDSTSTVSTTSTPLTPTSRPTTPTFLPLPSSTTINSHMPTLKRAGPPGPHRSSLGTSSPTPIANSFLHTPTSYREKLGLSQSASEKSLPPTPSHIPTPTPTRTISPPLSGIPKSRSMRPPSALSQSRIGKPVSGRRSAGADDPTPLLSQKDTVRMRSGSTTFAGRGF